jgi:predicted DsbA family dithiol-disulfide isomerase
MKESILELVNRTETQAPAALRIDVIADFVCPWSYIGRHRLNEALGSVLGPVHVAWHPFQLNPDMPEEGVTLEDYLRDKFGEPEALQPALDQLTRLGAAEGLELAFDRIARVPNTRAAHRLMKLAEIEGRQNELAELLYRAFFSAGRDIGRHDVLVELARQAGLTPETAAQYLDDERIDRIVLAEEAQARKAGVTSVPDYMINKRLFVVGAQSEATLLGAFDRAMFGEDSDLTVSETLH